MEKLNKENIPLILITGFGPFDCHEANASELVVRNLSLPDLEHELKAKIQTKVLDTDYNFVKTYIPAQWQSLKPKLVIHLGVSCFAKKVTLEEKAFNDGYTRLDIKSFAPCDKTCLKNSPSELNTKLDLKKIHTEISEAETIGYEISSDPGSYLCGYVYYISLNIDRSRTVFIHVPTLKTISDDNEKALKILTSSVVSAIKAIYYQVSYTDDLK